MTIPAQCLIDARRRDSSRRCKKVLDALDRLAADGVQISVSAIARAAGVHRSLIYRHPDLHTAVITRAHTPSASPAAGPSVSSQSLLADLANLSDRARRQDIHIRHLEKRLAEALGEQVWRESGLAGPPDYDALVQRITHLEQENIEFRRELADREQDLDAARAANRRLIAQVNLGPDGATNNHR